MKTTRRISAVVSILIVLAFAASYAEEKTPSITVEDLTGIWHSTGEYSPYLQLDEDGTFRVAGAAPWLETSPFEVGQFRLEGMLVTFVPTGGANACMDRRGNYQSGSYRVELTKKGQLQFILQEDPCQVRANAFPKAPWSRFEP